MGCSPPRRCGLCPQVALIDVLTSLGLKPDGIIGHSLGEVACGYADGCLTLEETVLCAYWRGQLIKESSIPPGAMAAVGRCCPGSPPRSGLGIARPPPSPDSALWPPGAWGPWCRARSPTGTAAKASVVLTGS